MKYIIRVQDSIGNVQFYDKKSGTHHNAYFCSSPYKWLGYVSFDRAYFRLCALSEKYPEFAFDIISLPET